VKHCDRQKVDWLCNITSRGTYYKLWSVLTSKKSWMPVHCLYLPILRNSLRHSSLTCTESIACGLLRKQQHSATTRSHSYLTTVLYKKRSIYKVSNICQVVILIRLDLNFFFFFFTTRCIVWHAWLSHYQLLKIRSQSVYQKFQWSFSYYMLSDSATIV